MRPAYTAQPGAPPFTPGIFSCLFGPHRLGGFKLLTSFVNFVSGSIGSCRSARPTTLDVVLVGGKMPPPNPTPDAEEKRNQYFKLLIPLMCIF